MKTQITACFLLLAATCGADLYILQDSPSGKVWTNSTGGATVIEARGTRRSNPALWVYRDAGFPLAPEDSMPIVYDSEAREFAYNATSLQQARAMLSDRAPGRVRDARAKIEAIGQSFGLTNEKPDRIVRRVMRTNTNAANAVLRAEAVWAAQTIRDYKLAKQIGLADDEDEP